MTKFYAAINTPGYLPDYGEPAPIFDTAADAWAYLESERAEHEASVTEDSLIVASECLSELRRIAEALNVNSVYILDSDGTGTVYGPTPGYEGDHDLGLAYTVDFAEDD
jgi:hypothetical protein